MSTSFDELLRGGSGIEDVSALSDVGSQKSLLMIFIVDCSGSMEGDRIASVNEAFKTMIPTLQRIQVDVRSDFALNIAIMAFGSVAEWIVPPKPVMEYFHRNIKADRGGTDYGNMLRALQEKLTRSQYIPSSGKVSKPYIMLLTDGRPYGSRYESELKELERNLWYHHAERYAVLIGEKAIEDDKARAAVRAFVSNEAEGIIDAADAQVIAESVHAKTIHTIKLMTHKGGNAGGEAEPDNTGEKKDFDWTFPTDFDALAKSGFVF